MVHVRPFGLQCSEAISAYARLVKFNPSILHVQKWLAPVVGFWVPQTLDRFELWGACGDLNLPSLPTRDPLSLARRAQRNRETQRFILVWATLRCNTLL